MQTESINRNYERNRESRTRKRRFRGATNTESLHEATMKTPPGIRRSRIDMPPRSTKSLSNLSQIDKEPIEDPNNNAGAVTLLPFSRFLKWCKHISMTRETPPPSNSGKSDSFDPNLSPVWHQQSGNIGRKRGFVGPLGLGEYVDSMGGGFDELDLPSAPTHGQGKSRSLIDISMSNLWGAEEQDSKLPESGNCEEEVSEKVHKSSASEDRRPTILLLFHGLFLFHQPLQILCTSSIVHPALPTFTIIWRPHFSAIRRRDGQLRLLLSPPVLKCKEGTYLV